MLVTRCVCTYAVHRDALEAHCASPSAQPHAALLRLPPELLDIICAHLAHAPARAGGLVALAALAATCSALLHFVGRTHVVRARARHAAPWTGGRLLCLSVAGTRPGDVPPALRGGARGGGGEDEGEGEGAGRGLDAGGAGGFVQAVCARYRLVFGWVWELARVGDAAGCAARIAEEMEARKNAPRRCVCGAAPVGAGEGARAGGEGREVDAGPAMCPDWRGHVLADAVLFAQLCLNEDWAPSRSSSTSPSSSPGSSPGPPPPPKRPFGWPRALANLSRGEYVREDRLPFAGVAARSQVRVAWGHVLLARICWASKGRAGFFWSTAARVRVPRPRGEEEGEEDLGEGEDMATTQGEEREYDYELTRGAWAGDRFAIVPLAALCDLAPDRAGHRRGVGTGKGTDNGEGWREVSEELDAELRLIWERQGIEELDSDVSGQGPDRPFEPWEVFFE